MNDVFMYVVFPLHLNCVKNVNQQLNSQESHQNDNIFPLHLSCVKYVNQLLKSKESN